MVNSVVLQEIIQNADDAGATEVKFFLDFCQLQTLPPGLVTNTEKQVELSRFYGPALMSFNNAPFKKEDWDSIQSLHQSGKAKNSHKVGKFGIGFTSVYHITGKYSCSWKYNEFMRGSSSKFIFHEYSLICI